MNKTRFAIIGLLSAACFLPAAGIAYANRPLPAPQFAEDAPKPKAQPAPQYPVVELPEVLVRVAAPRGKGAVAAPVAAKPAPCEDGSVRVVGAMKAGTRPGEGATGRSTVRTVCHADPIPADQVVAPLAPAPTAMPSLAARIPQ